MAFILHSTFVPLKKRSSPPYSRRHRYYIHDRFEVKCVSTPPAHYSRRGLRVWIDSHTIRQDEEVAIDAVHVDATELRVTLTDYGITTENDEKENNNREVTEKWMAELTQPNSPLFDDPIRRLSFTLSKTPPENPQASVLHATLHDDTFRVAWLGAVGFLIIRTDDNSIIARSHSKATKEALDELLSLPIDQHAKKRNSNNNRIVLENDFHILQDGDVVLLGSDGFWANLTDEQILAFVRPVPDPIDKTLSIANNTCLGSWTRPDPTFLACHLANLAHNFSTASNSQPLLAFPFPPSPHADDITVVVAHCEFDEH